MKTWNNAEIVELSIAATAELPTNAPIFDDQKIGEDGRMELLQGDRNGSGSQVEVIYKPAN